MAQSWGDFNVNEGDHIVVALSEHHSDLLPWLLLARRRNAVLDFIPLLPDGRLDLGEYERLLSQRPKLVCVAHVSNVLGIVNPVADMARMAHEASARFMLDAAQSFPHLPFNVKEIGCDFAAFSAHKMYGPLGIGGLFIGKDAFDEMDPVASAAARSRMRLSIPTTFARGPSNTRWERLPSRRQSAGRAPSSIWKP